MSNLIRIFFSLRPFLSVEASWKTFLISENNFKDIFSKVKLWKQNRKWSKKIKGGVYFQIGNFKKNLLVFSNILNKNKYFEFSELLFLKKLNNINRINKQANQTWSQIILLYSKLLLLLKF